MSITEELRRWRSSGDAPSASLVEAVYPQLRAIARQQLRQQAGRMTLRATEVAHEAYLRLLDQQLDGFANRQHFFALVALLMRRVIVDYQRERLAQKRGGDLDLVELDSLACDEHPQVGDSIDWLALEQALSELERSLPEIARIVELKLYCGLEAEAIAGLTGISVRSIGRHWQFARAFLRERLALQGESSAG